MVTPFPGGKSKRQHQRNKPSNKIPKIEENCDFEGYLTVIHVFTIRITLLIAICQIFI